MPLGRRPLEDSGLVPARHPQTHPRTRRTRPGGAPPCGPGQRPAPTGPRPGLAAHPTYDRSSCATTSAVPCPARHQTAAWTSRPSSSPDADATRCSRPRAPRPGPATPAAEQPRPPAQGPGPAAAPSSRGSHQATQRTSPDPTEPPATSTPRHAGQHAES